MEKRELAVHEVCEFSKVNGPGTRAVVWVQGCSIGCPGCFNPETHEADGAGNWIDAAALGRQIGTLAVDGLTVSGGEPLDQPEGVAALIEAFRERHGGTVLLFTGYSLERIRKSPEMRRVLVACDAVLAGPYDQRAAGIWARKELLLVTGRIRPEELVAERRIELSLGAGRGVLLTGFPGEREKEVVTKNMGMNA
jgi:anaerobic ribonucleoside-triphosphate reductase activating protein